MRKLKVGALLSVDGIHGEPRSWVGSYFDDEAAAESLAELRRADAMLMGRHTYEYFAPAWPNTPGPYAERVNAIAKYVFSSTLAGTDWSNATVVAADPVKSVAELKTQGDGDLVIYGFGRLAQTLLEHDLVDELNFWLHPVVAGSGTPVFRSGISSRLDLAEVSHRPNGVVSLSYTKAPA
ncbi:bifunctional deaminase-reductase domain protein [Kribbella flavida DSM 17836]|uniref:Bifunctional deaminase-reductase domain protein n=1 Tax=Kribbella flavida (strain DSM 17836 / JCM 10339 / NBRC 14399) TaxID=479435 RepID=D2PU93_KRIFD|nr:dihydrofolate reductase family protein [Kribbella flavida]ADB35144.1 bifunctional deaminase-reductase domain protein [Kribbella flavida DSM 17836]